MIVLMLCSLFKNVLIWWRYSGIDCILLAIQIEDKVINIFFEKANYYYKRHSFGLKHVTTI